MQLQQLDGKLGQVAKRIQHRRDTALPKLEEQLEKLQDLVKQAVPS